MLLIQQLLALSAAARPLWLCVYRDAAATGRLLGGELLRRDKVFEVYFDRIRALVPWAHYLLRSPWLESLLHFTCPCFKGASAFALAERFPKIDHFYVFALSLLVSFLLFGQ